ncbi:hypothetical protein GR702_05545 [Novosphingobium sp. FGD1]|uniref:Uncharacterized protein n=1 Tax=Novosphingobium silvae TaxID=2692619 RepID=A0A7X4GF36_9SPHN|nr:hypothetical protein [Novosphingobium silvae]MYL97235.1 hypothetical protein [Novosphingobium silvae]
MSEDAIITITLVAQGRMDDPNAHLTTLFTGAARTWHDIRTVGDTKVTLQ